MNYNVSQQQSKNAPIDNFLALFIFSPYSSVNISSTFTPKYLAILRITLDSGCNDGFQSPRLSAASPASPLPFQLALYDVAFLIFNFIFTPIGSTFESKDIFT